MIEITALRIGSKRFHALVQNLGELVTVHDATGTMRYATPSTRKLLGYPKEQLTGQKAFELIHPDDLGQA